MASPAASAPAAPSARKPSRMRPQPSRTALAATSAPIATSVTSIVLVGAAVIGTMWRCAGRNRHTVTSRRSHPAQDWS